MIRGGTPEVLVVAHLILEEEAIAVAVVVVIVGAEAKGLFTVYFSHSLCEHSLLIFLN